MGNICLCPQEGQQLRYGLMFLVVTIHLSTPPDGLIPAPDLNGFFGLSIVTDGVAFPL
jgi:hypothetical protein